MDAIEAVSLVVLLLKREILDSISTLDLVFSVETRDPAHRDDGKVVARPELGPAQPVLFVANARDVCDDGSVLNANSMFGTRSTRANIVSSHDANVVYVIFVSIRFATFILFERNLLAAMYSLFFHLLRNAFAD